MRVDSKTLSPARLEKAEDVETLKTLGIFCGAGLLLSLLAMQAIAKLHDGTHFRSEMVSSDHSLSRLCRHQLSFADAGGRAIFTFAAPNPSARSAGMWANGTAGFEGIPHGRWRR
jgi:hypothetical protein